METEKLLEATVISALKRMKISLDELKNRPGWAEAKESFIEEIVLFMTMLKGFAFTEKEIKDFIIGANAKLELAMALYILKLAISISHNMADLKENFLLEWEDDDLFDNLAVISRETINEFVELKGGVCF